MTTTTRQCKANTKAGQRCQAWAVSDSDYCFMHDPASAKARAQARAAGGRARHGRRVGVTGDGDPVSLASVGDVLDLLQRTARDLFKLENSVSRARAVTSLCTAALKVFEVGELEERIAALENLMEVQG